MQTIVFQQKTQPIPEFQKRYGCLRIFTLQRTSFDWHGQPKPFGHQSLTISFSILWRPSWKVHQSSWFQSCGLTNVSDNVFGQLDGWSTWGLSKTKNQDQQKCVSGRLAGTGRRMMKSVAVYGITCKPVKCSMILKWLDGKISFVPDSFGPRNHFQVSPPCFSVTMCIGWKHGCPSARVRRAQLLEGWRSFIRSIYNIGHVAIIFAWAVCVYCVAAGLLIFTSTSALAGVGWGNLYFCKYDFLKIAKNGTCKLERGKTEKKTHMMQVSCRYAFQWALPLTLLRYRAPWSNTWWSSQPTCL